MVFKKGYKQTEEHRRKNSEGHKGKHYSLETRKKHSELMKGNTLWLGKHRSLETKKKISNGLKGIHRSEETLRKMSESRKGEKCYMFGKHHSEEHNKKVSLALKGEKNPSWKGGLSFEPYTLDFNNSFKKLIRERDNYCCLVCNKLQEELKEELSIHHIDYNKLNSFPQNCVSLCRSCHTKTGINRTQWTTFFQSLLKEIYGYQYTQDQKIILDF